MRPRGLVLRLCGQDEGSCCWPSEQKSAPFPDPQNSAPAGSGIPDPLEFTFSMFVNFWGV